MKAIRIHSFGDADVLTLEDANRPEPNESEVLIRVEAASVNPVDYKIRSGSYKKSEIKLPLTLGRDVSGTVERVGSRVTSVKAGDEVYAFLGSTSGGYAEYAVAKSNEVAAKPTSIDHVHAAAVPLAAITAWQALFDHGKLQAGQRVLIHGGAGGVGHLAIQFAKARGATVIATGRGEDLDFLRKLGADQVIDYKKDSFEKQTKDIDLVIDLVAGETQKKSWDVLKPGGILVSTLQQPSKDDANAHHAQGKVFMAEPKAEQLREIAQLIDQGKVTVVVSKILPLSEARQAHHSLEEDHLRGKLVLTVSHPAGK